MAEVASHDLARLGSSHFGQVGAELHRAEPSRVAAALPGVSVQDNLIGEARQSVDIFKV